MDARTQEDIYVHGSFWDNTQLCKYSGLFKPTFYIHWINIDFFL